MTRPGFPPPVRRPATPVPPLPHYGGRAPVPAPVPVPAPRPAAADREPVDEPPFEGAYARYQRLAAARGDGWQDGYRYDDDADPYADSSYDDPRYDADDDHGYDADHGYDDEPARTNRMAVWGLVLAFLFAPLGLVLSAVGISQTGRRRERGRGLAIAGLVVSVVVLGCAALFAGAVASELADQLADDTAAAAEVVGVAPTAPAPTSVLEACTTLMPVFVAAEQRIPEAATKQDTVQVVADMRAATLWATAAPDAAFQQHLQTLATSLQTLADATTTGEVLPGIEATMEEHSFMVGKDCGLAGWTR